MSEPDDYPLIPHDPVSETQLRITKTRETMRSSDEVRIDPPPWKKGETVGGFLIERLIGSGVTSSVYRARELKTGRIFALKVLRTRCEETRTASRLGFRRIQPLSHPSLIHVHEMLQIGQFTAFKLEFVSGQRLLEVIRSTNRNDRLALFEIATRLLHDVGGALNAIHESYSVHRDVKPENVMLDSKGRFRLIDYGLVGCYDPVSDPDARRNYLAGTYWYMAPESITSQIYPPACDVYALGCIVLELIADRSKLPKEQAGISLGQSIGDVRSFLPADTPPELADLLCDMLDHVPQNRPVAARLVQVGRASLKDWSTHSKVRHTHLYGREKEMAIAEHWAHGVVGGRPSRLHISGESGVGKTWFLAELQRRIRANVWFQVFDSACRERADVPLQAFDVMADAIARRYSRDDRDPLALKPQHALILRQAFPSLRAVIKEPVMSPEEELEARQLNFVDPPDSADAAAQRLELARSHALFAGVDLVERMCEYGPLFLIIDDSQWADQDSINVLDKLLSEAKGELGIITIGRSPIDGFREPADCVIELDRLSDADAIELLRSIVQRDGFIWQHAALKRLAALGEGNALRLTQLAACISCDGAMAWHDRLMRGHVEIEDIWQSRLAHIGDNARTAIQFMAIAGGPIRAIDLAQVSQLMGDCDDAVRELVSLSLIYDEAPKREAIDIVHLRVRRSIIEHMEASRQRAIHAAWATYLMTCDADPWRSARIAGHLIEAKQNEAAIPHILQAARDAEARFAFTEAARWHMRASLQLEGNESVSHLTQAINHFEDAGQPNEAANACQCLIDHPARCDKSQDLQLLLRLAKNLLRAGNIDQAREIILSRIVSIPLEQSTSFKSPANAMAVAIRAHRAASKQGVSKSIDATSQVPVGHELGEIFAAVYRPLLTIDVSQASSILFAFTSSQQRSQQHQSSLRSFVDMSVMQCRNGGPRRRRATKRLMQSVEMLGEANKKSHDNAALAEVNCGLAFRHLLACDWASAIAPATHAINAFRIAGESCRFDEVHSLIPLLWSYFWLGRIAEMKKAAQVILRDVNERKDEYLRRMLFVGVGSAVALVDDNARLSNAMHRKFVQQFGDDRSQWWTVVDGFSPLMRYVYEGRANHSLRYLRKLASDGRSQTLQQMQLLRVLYWQWEATMRLRLAMHHPMQRNESIAKVRFICDQLHHEQIPFAKTLAMFLQAQSHEISGEKQPCLDQYARAADAADSLDLVPIRLMAIDRMHLVNGDNQASELKRFLAFEGVVAPEKFARLYCGLS